jgi:hypothetical protein
MPNTLQIPFGEGSNGAYKLLLDAAKNNQLTTFTVDKDVFIRLYTGNHHPALYAMRGVVRFDAENIIEELTEELVIIHSKAASLQYPAAGVIAMLWTGRERVNAVVAGDAVMLDKVSTGILTITYITVYDRLAATSSIIGKDIVEAQGSDRYGSLVIDYIEEITGPVTINTVAACKGEKIEGASVTVDGLLVGLTNANGEVSGVFTLGVQHSIEVRKEGFLNTGDDLIANDYFACPITDDDRRRAAGDQTFTAGTPGGGMEWRRVG